MSLVTFAYWAACLWLTLKLRHITGLPNHSPRWLWHHVTDITFVALQRIYIALPEAKARSHMFKVHLGDTPHDLQPKDFEELGQRTEGFSGSDVSVVVKDVLMEPVRLTQDAGYFR